MKIERTQNAKRNIIFGMLLKVYQIIMPFFMRTLLLYSMGAQYLGLNGLFFSVLQVLNLAELGIGSAMIYSMYKPIVEDDTEKICALIKLYRTYYRVIGLIIGAAGLVLTPFIPHLIQGDVPSEINIYVLYLLNLSCTVISYWLFAYKDSLYIAHQRVDMTNKVRLATSTVQYILQFLVLCFIKNYYLYIIIDLVTQALANISIGIAATKSYPQYKPMGNLERSEVKKINGRIRDLFTTKFSTVIVNSVDTIVISAFLGLAMLAVYQNYYYIMTSIISIIAVIFRACTAGIGNSVIVESKEKNYTDLKKFTFIIAWIAGFCACCLLCLYQPFMKIWVGEDMLLGISAVICFCTYYFVHEINQLLNTYKDAAGIWHEDQFRPLVTAIANLIMNLIMVQFWGIYGVLLSTVLSTVLIGMPWIIHNLFTMLFEKCMIREYTTKLILYTAITAVVCAVTYGLCSLVPMEGWTLLIIRGVICCVVPNVLFLLIYRKMPEFAQSIQLADTLTKGKLKLGKRLRTDKR